MRLHVALRILLVLIMEHLTTLVRVDGRIVLLSRCVDHWGVGGVKVLMRRPDRHGIHGMLGSHHELCIPLWELVWPAYWSLVSSMEILSLKMVGSSVKLLVLGRVDKRTVNRVSMGMSVRHALMFVFITVYISFICTFCRLLACIGCPVMSYSCAFNINGRRCSAKILLGCRVTLFCHKISVLVLARIVPLETNLSSFKLICSILVSLRGVRLLHVVS